MSEVYISVKWNIHKIIMEQKGHIFIFFKFKSLTLLMFYIFSIHYSIMQNVYIFVSLNFRDHSIELKTKSKVNKKKKILKDFAN